VIQWDDNARPVQLKGKYVRDENEQARYITELLDVFSTEGVDSVFVYTFARYDLANRSVSQEDFDMASPGLVKVLDTECRGQRYPDMAWEPRLAFTALAEYYSALDC
jgi:hypothetical protein